MKYPYIKNIAHEEALALSGQVVTQPGQIVSKTLAQNGAVSITLFAFDKDEEISTHDSDGDAMATVLEGTPIHRRRQDTPAERRRNPGYACQKAACGLCKRTI